MLSLKPTSYEAYYARAKAKLDLRLFESAQSDVREAIKMAPAQSLEVRKVLAFLRDEIANKMTSPSRNFVSREFAVSVDALHE